MVWDEKCIWLNVKCPAAVPSRGQSSEVTRWRSNCTNRRYHRNAETPRRSPTWEGGSGCRIKTCSKTSHLRVYRVTAQRKYQENVWFRAGVPGHDLTKAAHKEEDWHADICKRFGFFLASRCSRLHPHIATDLPPTGRYDQSCDGKRNYVIRSIWSGGYAVTVPTTYRNTEWIKEGIYAFECSSSSFKLTDLIGHLKVIVNQRFST